MKPKVITIPDDDNALTVEQMLADLYLQGYEVKHTITRTTDTMIILESDKKVVPLLGKYVVYGQISGTTDFKVLPLSERSKTQAIKLFKMHYPSSEFQFIKAVGWEDFTTYED